MSSFALAKNGEKVKYQALILYILEEIYGNNRHNYPHG